MAPTNPCSHSAQRTSSIHIATQVTQSASVPVRPYVARVMLSEIRRLRYVSSGLSQLEAYARSSNARELNTSAIQIHDFVAESSDETPFERFLAWNPVEDSNVVYARLATAEAVRRAVVAAAAALNALPESDEREDDAAEDEQDGREDDGVDEEGMNDDGTDSDDDGDDDDDMGGIQIGGE
ncbi:hypothetical protein HOY82DRAFT_369886 [Tuber indicum]|nr:hypothetical protein HOY82DRAFT_369886 [Tuber indicum]